MLNFIASKNLIVAQTSLMGLTFALHQMSCLDSSFVAASDA